MVTAVSPRRIVRLMLAVLLCGQGAARGAWVWVEGESARRSTWVRHNWYESVHRDRLSRGAFLSHFDAARAGEAEFAINAPKTGSYDLWVRANPVQSRLTFALNDAPFVALDLDKEQRENTNIAADDKPDLRFLAWSRVGKFVLKKGPNRVRFRAESPGSHHGALDCFVFVDEPFTPRGTARPGEASEASRRARAANPGWFPFEPAVDRHAAGNPIDLRPLNEKRAGDGGFIAARGGQFVHSKTGAPVRFWGVNGPSSKGPEGLRADARVLAKRGVNLVRIHHGYYDANGVVDPRQVLGTIEAVEALKAEGIYSHLSIYFPIWLTPAPNTPWLQGYDGKTHPFAALYFNKDFQKQYQSWWRALLQTPNPATGRPLVDEPAVAGVEIVNEDSYFFWTFNAQNVPDAQLRIVEGQYGDWLKARYGSIEGATKRWGGVTDARDRPSEGRLGFRPHWNMITEKTPRDRDAARFLAESQRRFYQETTQFLRGLGVKGLVTASNWVTASPEVLGPLEKYTYTVGDFIDRHGYFAGATEGPDSGWAIKEGLVYADRSALRFDPDMPGKPKQYTHPAADPSYDGKPSMISETTWNRPNRFRTEAPLYYAAYGALQGSDAVVHFAFDTAGWSVKPGYFMQPWTLMAPSQVGQFPAAALIFRKGLVAEGALLADLDLKLGDLFDLKGTPLPQDAAFDELRLKDVPKGLALRPGEVIDPLIHFAGRTAVRFSERGGPAVLKDLRGLVDRKRQVVTASHGQVRLDYGKGVLTLNAPAAQGASGMLKEAGTVDLKDMTLTSAMPLGHVVAVSLDGLPLATSRRVLLQVMSEEKVNGAKTVEQPDGRKKLVAIGDGPWLVKEFEGAVKFKRADAARLKVTRLDPNGDAAGASGNASAIRLDPTTLYYVIEAGGA